MPVKTPLTEICNPKQWPTIKKSVMSQTGAYPVYGANGIIGRFNDFNHSEETLLIGCRGSCGSIHISKGKSYITGNAMALDDLNANICDMYYLYRFIEYRGLKDATTGTSQPQITRTMLERVDIPLPPLEEQKRIAELLDKADELRRKRRESIAALDSLTQSIFLDLFGDPESTKWPMTTVEQLAEPGKGMIRTGPFGSQLLHSEFVDKGIAVLGIDNAVQNRFRWAKPRFITEEKYKKLSRYTVRPRDVLITVMGTCGRCAIVPEKIPTTINTKHLCCITLNQKKCLPEFLHAYFLMHPTAKSYLLKTAKGAIMKGLNGGIIKELPVPEVPFELQKEYQKISNKIEIQRTRLLAAQTKTENFFLSLQQKAFAS